MTVLNELEYDNLQIEIRGDFKQAAAETFFLAYFNKRAKSVFINLSDVGEVDAYGINHLITLGFNLDDNIPITLFNAPTYVKDRLIRYGLLTRFRFTQWSLSTRQNKGIFAD